MSKDVKLFSVYLGGSTTRSNIELHDVVFVVGATLQETYPKLKEKWLGYPDKVPHIDSYIALDCVDGFQITLTEQLAATDGYKLYYVNFGGYQANLFGEIHQAAFYVAKDKAAAIQKARKELCVGMLQSHLDNQLDVEELISSGQYDVDDLLEIDQVDGYRLQFSAAPEMKASIAHAGYIRL